MRHFCLFLLALCFVASVQGDYVRVIGWIWQPETTCAALNTTQFGNAAFDTTLYSDINACQSLWPGSIDAKIACRSNGTFYGNFYAAGSQCTGTAYPIYPTSAPWGSPSCLTPLQISPQFIDYLMAVCTQDSSPAPTAPVPTAPVPVAPTPQASFTKNVFLEAFTTASCSGTSINSVNVVGDSSACQGFGTSLYFKADCDANGAPIGSTCGSDSTCNTCTPWAASSGPWGTSACVVGTTPSLRATCSQVTPSPSPSPTPTPTPSPSPSPSPAPIAPTPIAFAAAATMTWSASTDSTCSASTGISGTLSSDPGVCQTLGTNSVRAWCSTTGAPIISLCSTGCSSCTTTSSTNTWGQSTCVVNSPGSVRLTCLQSTPTSTGPVTPPVSSGGDIKFYLYTSDTQCSKRPASISTIRANISQCQSVTLFGQSIWMKADCYADNTAHGAICRGDETCTSCTPLPNAASDSCVPYTYLIIKAIKITCPPPLGSSAVSLLVSNLIVIGSLLFAFLTLSST